MLNIKLDKSARYRAISDKILEKMDRERQDKAIELKAYKEKVDNLLSLLEEGYEDTLALAYASGKDCCEIDFKNNYCYNCKHEIENISKSDYFNKIFTDDITMIKGDCSKIDSTELMYIVESSKFFKYQDIVYKINNVCSGIIFYFK